MVLVVKKLSMLKKKLVDSSGRHNNRQGHTFDETPLSITL
jgi:hypothetical protein